MPIPVECPFCSEKYRVRDQFAGKSVKCKKCGGEMRVPDGSSSGKRVAGKKSAIFDDDEDTFAVKKGDDDWESSFSTSRKPLPRTSNKVLSRSNSWNDATDDDDDAGNSTPKSRRKKPQKSSVNGRVIALAAAAAIAATSGGVIFNMVGRKAQPAGGDAPQVVENNPLPGFPPGGAGNPPEFPPVNLPPTPNLNPGPRPGLPGFPGIPGPQPRNAPELPAANPPPVNPQPQPAPAVASQNPPRAAKAKAPEKKPSRSGFQPVETGDAQAGLQPWTVEADPPAEPVALEADAKVKVMFPKNSKLELVYPAGPSSFVAVGSNNNEREIREVRDLRSNAKVGTIKGARVNAQNWTLSPDGKYLAAWILHEKGVRVWDVKAGKPLGQVEFEKGGFLKLFQFAGTERLVACGQDGSLRIWQLPSGTEERTIQLPNSVRENQLGISPGGKYLGMIDGDHNKTVLRLYDLTSGKIAGETLITGEATRPHQCQAIEFSPDGQEIAAIFEHWDDLTMVVWSATTGEEAGDFKFENSIKKLPAASWRKDRPLVWFPNRQRWLYHGLGIIDRSTQKIVWTMPDADQPPAHDFPTMRRVLDDGHVLVALAEGKEAGIINFALPESEISAGATVVAAGGLAIDARLPPLTKANWGNPPKLVTEAGGASWSVQPDPVGAGAAELLTKPLQLSPSEDPLRSARLAGPEAARLVVLYGPDKGQNRRRVRPRSRGKEAPAKPAGSAAAELSVVDLAEGKEIGDVDLPYAADLMSVSLDGKLALVRLQDGLSRLDIFSLDDGEHVMGFRPYSHQEKDRDQQVKAAVLVDNDHVLTLSETDTLALWNLKDCRAVYQIERAAQPGVTPGRKYFSVSNGKGYRLFDALTGGVKGDVLAGDQVAILGAAGYSQAGDRMAATINQHNGFRLICWDLRSGQLTHDFVIPVVAHELHFCGDDHVLLDNKVLVDIPHKMVVWNYDLPFGKGVHLPDSPDGRHWYLSAPGGQNSAITVTAVEMPHEGAQSILEGKKLDPGYILRPGGKATVRFNITQSPPEKPNFQQEVWTKLADRLKQNDVTVVDNDNVIIYVSMSHKMTGEKHSFRLSGFGRGGINQGNIEVQGQVVECGLQVWQGNTMVWNGNQRFGNDAFFFQVKEGQSVEKYLQDSMWNAAANHLLNFVPPAYVLPENAAKGLGQSTLTADGVR